MTTPDHSKIPQKTTGFNVDKHLFQFGYSDGFSERLLSIHLWVTLDFDFIMEYSTFQVESKIEHGKLPEPICHQIEKLIELDVLKLEEEYDIHPGATDYSTYFVRINQYGVIHFCSFGQIPVSITPNSPFEQLLFETIESFQIWAIEQTGFEIG